MKPDIVAVGEEIVTAAQDSFPSGQSWDPSGFIDSAGTKFFDSADGRRAAVLKAARPGLTVAQYRSLLNQQRRPRDIGPGSAGDRSAGRGRRAETSRPPSAEQWPHILPP